jgi:hypothetical protein
MPGWLKPDRASDAVPGFTKAEHKQVRDWPGQEKIRWSWMEGGRPPPWELGQIPHKSYTKFGKSASLLVR